MVLKLTASLKGAVRWDDQAKVFLSFCPALNIYSQGLSEDEAREALESTMRLYIETCIERGILEQILRRAGFNKSSEKAVPRQQLYDEYIMVERFDRVFDMDIPIHLIASQQGSINAGPGARSSARV